MSASSTDSTPRPAVGSRAAFSRAADGDLRRDPAARRAVSERLGVPTSWATVTQVHGAGVVEAATSGDHGEADALITTIPDLPLAVFTADCLGVVVHADAVVAVAHAGWRGLAAGVLEATLEAMRARGITARRAEIGPAIGPCCFEVGPEVAERFPDHIARTTWGTTSVDLVAAAATRLHLPTVQRGGCTRCGDDAFSHRRDRTSHRMAAVGWLSADVAPAGRRGDGGGP